MADPLLDPAGPGAPPGGVQDGGTTGTRARRTPTATSLVVVVALLTAVLAGAFVIDAVTPNPAAAGEERHIQLDCRIDNPSCGPMALPGWSNADGFTREDQRGTIQVADLDGNGTPELLGRRPDGLHVWTFQPADETCSITVAACGMWSPYTPAVLPQLSDAKGFGEENAAVSIRTADLDGDGRREVVALSAAGLSVYKLAPDGTVSAWQTDTTFTGAAMPDLLKPQYVRTLRVGNVDDRPGDELVLRVPEGVVTIGYDPATGRLVHRPVVAELADGTPIGSREEHWATINLVDFDGSGRRQLVANSPDGLQAWWYDTGRQAWQTLGSVQEGTATRTQKQFARPEAYRAMIPVPYVVDGHRVEAILVRDPQNRTVGLVRYWFEAGRPSPQCTTACWGGRAFKDAGADALTAPAGNLGVITGYLRVLDGGDPAVNRTRLVLNTGDGVTVFTLAPGKPMAAEKLPVFTEGAYRAPENAGLWTYAATGQPTLLLARDSKGMRTAAETSHGWASPSAEYPVFTGPAPTAYDALSAGVGAAGVGGVRANYALDKSVLASYRVSMTMVAKPATVPDDVWAAVKAQLDAELRAAIATDAFFDQQQHLIESTYSSTTGRAHAAASRLELMDIEHTEVVNRPAETALAFEEGLVKTIGMGGIAKHGVSEVAELVGLGLRLLTEQLVQQDHQGEFRSKVADMDARMADSLSVSRAVFNKMNSQVVDDYGWMMTFGQRVESKQWLLDGEGLNAVIAGMERGADEQTYRVLMPISFEVGVCWDRWGGARLRCNLTKDPDNRGVDVPPEVTQTFSPEPGKTLTIWLSHYVKPQAFADWIAPVTDRELLKKLYEEPDESCLREAWTSECGFGFSITDIALHRTPIRLVCMSESLDQIYGSIHKYRGPCVRPPTNNDDVELRLADAPPRLAAAATLEPADDAVEEPPTLPSTVPATTPPSTAAPATTTTTGPTTPTTAAPSPGATTTTVAPTSTTTSTTAAVARGSGGAVGTAPDLP